MLKHWSYAEITEPRNYRFTELRKIGFALLRQDYGQRSGRQPAHCSKLTTHSYSVCEAIAEPKPITNKNDTKGYKKVQIGKVIFRMFVSLQNQNEKCVLWLMCWTKILLLLPQLSYNLAKVFLGLRTAVWERVLWHVLGFALLRQDNGLRLRQDYKTTSQRDN